MPTEEHMFVEQTEVRGRADHHRHLIKHISTDPPRHFFHLCTMEGQWAGNRCPRVALLPQTDETNTAIR